MSTPAPLATNLTASKPGQKHADDIVIVSALRTPLGRAKRGILKDTPVEELLSAVLKATVDRTKIDPAIVGDIVVGSVLGGNVQRANEARIGQFLAGFPDTVPVHLINRQCSSGLQAVAHVAANITAGYYDVGIAAGVESMSRSAFTWEGGMNPKIFLNQQAKDCLLPMGITSENVAKRYGVSRKEQDEFAVSSHTKAAAAIKSGKFKNEIIPITVKVKDEKTGAEKEVVADTDDGVRPETTFESLSKLKPAFTKDGTTTAGNASQVTDGGAAVLLMKRSQAEKLKLPIEGVFRTYAVAGCPPDVMGIGPAVAIPPALKQAGLSVNDIDVYEINEAFASQAVYCVKKLGIPIERVNPNGGAIALGHPLGCTGARQVATLLNELARRKARYGLISMCIGSGIGAAAVLEYEPPVDSQVLSVEVPSQLGVNLVVGLQRWKCRTCNQPTNDLPATAPGFCKHCEAPRTPESLERKEFVAAGKAPNLLPPVTVKPPASNIAEYARWGRQQAVAPSMDRGLNLAGDGERNRHELAQIEVRRVKAYLAERPSQGHIAGCCEAKGCTIPSRNCVIHHLRPELKGIVGPREIVIDGYTHTMDGAPAHGGTFGDMHRRDHVIREVRNNTVNGVVMLQVLCIMHHNIVHDVPRMTNPNSLTIEKMEAVNKVKREMRFCKDPQCLHPGVECREGNEKYFHLDHFIDKASPMHEKIPEQMRKIKAVSQMVGEGQYSLDQTMFEVSKCRLLHGDCHEQHSKAQSADGNAWLMRDLEKNLVDYPHLGAYLVKCGILPAM